MHQTFQRSKKLSEFQHYRQTSITRRDHQARSPGAITKRCLPEIASRHRTNDPKPTHDHPAGLPLARAELFVRIVHDEVEEHVKAAEDARDLSAALEVEEQAAVHELWEITVSTMHQVKCEGRGCDEGWWWIVVPTLEFRLGGTGHVGEDGVREERLCERGGLGFRAALWVAFSDGETVLWCGRDEMEMSKEARVNECR